MAMDFDRQVLHAALQTAQPHRGLVRALKDRKRVATRYDRCPETFFSAVIRVAIALFWIWSRTCPEPKPIEPDPGRRVRFWTPVTPEAGALVQAVQQAMFKNPRAIIQDRHGRGH